MLCDAFLLSCLAVVAIALPHDAPRAVRHLCRGVGVLFAFAAIAASRA